MLHRTPHSLFVIGVSLTVLLTSNAVAQRRGGGGNRGGGAGQKGNFNKGGGVKKEFNPGGVQRSDLNRGGPQGGRDNGSARGNLPEGAGKKFDRSQINRDGLKRPNGAAGKRDGAPTRSDLENFLNRGGEGNRATIGKLLGPESAQGLENRGPQRLDAATRGNLKNNVTERGDRVRSQIDKNYPHWDFWKEHPNWASYRWNRPYRWATWGALGNWFGWSVPYVNYIYGDNLYYDDGNVYYDGTQVATDTEYAEQAQQYAEAGEQAIKNAGDNTEWMSLGVFALVHEKNEEPHMFFQLSVDNAGAIAGTYHDSATGGTKSVHGLVVKETQRACWSVEGKPDNVVETGIYNLTQDQTECLMHFGTDHTQTWLLVRMDENQDQSTEENNRDK